MSFGSKVRFFNVSFKFAVPCKSNLIIQKQDFDMVLMPKFGGSAAYHFRDPDQIEGAGLWVAIVGDCTQQFRINKLPSNLPPALKPP